MPIIAAEPTHFPEGLLSNPDIAAERTGQWWAVYTKSRGEKALARHLHARSIAYYLPLYRSTWQNKGRKFTSYLPLFTGYVFLYGDNDDRIGALESNQISRVLPVTDQKRLFMDLRRVERMLTAEAQVTPVDTLVPGQEVRIIAGPLEGLTGTLVRQGGQLRLVVEVTFLRQAVCAEVEPWMVEPANRPALVARAH